MNFHYGDLITIYRFKTLSGSKRHPVATATADTTIQPLGKEKGEIQSGQFGQQFLAFVDIETPVHISDLVKDRNGNRYTVVNMVTREYGAFPYIELLLQKARSQI